MALHFTANHDLYYLITLHSLTSDALLGRTQPNIRIEGLLDWLAGQHRNINLSSFFAWIHLTMSHGPSVSKDFIMFSFWRKFICMIAVHRFATLEPFVAKISRKQHTEFYTVSGLILWHTEWTLLGVDKYAAPVSCDW